MSNPAPLIGGFFQGMGALMEADDRAWALRDEGDALNRSAKIARAAGKFNAERQQVVAGKQLEEMKVGYATSGVSLDSGSVLDVLRESASNAEMDRMNILYSTELQAKNMEEGAAAAYDAAKKEKKKGNFQAFAAIFGGAMQSASYGSGGRGRQTQAPASSGPSNYSGYNMTGQSYANTGAIA